MTHRTLAVLSIAAALGLAAPAFAQEQGEAGRAAALDRLLGANADLPKPDPAPQSLGWMPAPLPPWLAAQPYRQQPLFATVPVGGTTRGGRVRTPGGP